MTATLLAPADRLANVAPQKIREVDVVTTAFQSVLSADMTYVSTPITSGSRLYEVLKRRGYTLPELIADKAVMLAEVIKPNVAEANEVAERLLHGIPGTTIISPAVFEARALGWGQSEYMALWLRVINQKVHRIAMLDGFAYSNGAVEELCEAILMQCGYRQRSDITVVRQDGSALSTDEAFAELVAAAYTLAERGFEARVLAETLHRLSWAQSEGRLTLSRDLHREAEWFLYESPELLSQLDPEFVSKCAASKVAKLREQEPTDVHLLRRRESFPESVRFRAIETDQ